MDVNAIILDAKYANYCRQISNNSQFWEDLYQEFRIKILSLKNKTTDNIDGYCYYIISNLWRDCNGYRPTRKNAMLFANYADRAYEVTDRIMSNEQEQDSSDVMTELNMLLKSENKKVKKQAEIFKECIGGTKRIDISREKSINYRIVHDAVRETAQTIKTNMTKNEIKSRLLAEGISSSYSGKDKTFYTNKKPSVDLEKKIIDSGFKQQKK